MSLCSVSDAGKHNAGIMQQAVPPSDGKRSVVAEWLEMACALLGCRFYRTRVHEDSPMSRHGAYWNLPQPALIHDRIKNGRSVAKGG